MREIIVGASIALALVGVTVGVSSPLGLGLWGTTPVRVMPGDVSHAPGDVLPIAPSATLGPGAKLLVPTAQSTVTQDPNAGQPYKTPRVDTTLNSQPRTTVVHVTPSVAPQQTSPSVEEPQVEAMPTPSLTSLPQPTPTSTPAVTTTRPPAPTATRPPQPTSTSTIVSTQAPATTAPQPAATTTQK